MSRIRGRKNILYIFILYLFLCLVSCFFFFIKKEFTKSHLEHYGSGFFVSFSASLFEDLIIFFTLSLIVILLTTQNLLDYSFDDKIKAIINSENSRDNQNIIDFLNASVLKLLAYDKDWLLTITVADYNVNGSAYKIYFDLKMRIVNMCRDKDHKREDYFFTSAPSDVIVNGEYGYVTLLEMTDVKTKNVTTITPNTNPVKLNEKYERSVPLSVLINSEVDIHFKYYTWSKTGDILDLKDLSSWNIIRNERYIEHPRVILCNQMKEALKFELYSNTKREKVSLSLEKNGVFYPGDTSYDINRELYPGDDVRLFLYKPEKV